jgi:DNA polymerase I-like protein with 3'-5' exonuclease and polymerase domains
MHTGMVVQVTRTGRVTSVEPNLQNLDDFGSCGPSLEKVTLPRQKVLNMG